MISDAPFSSTFLMTDPGRRSDKGIRTAEYTAIFGSRSGLSAPYPVSAAVAATNSRASKTSLSGKEKPDPNKGHKRAAKTKNIQAQPQRKDETGRKRRFPGLILTLASDTKGSIPSLAARRTAIMSDSVSEIFLLNISLILSAKRTMERQTAKLILKPEDRTMKGSARIITAEAAAQALIPSLSQAEQLYMKKALVTEALKPVIRAVRKAAAVSTEALVRFLQLSDLQMNMGIMRKDAKCMPDTARRWLMPALRKESFES